MYDCIRGHARAQSTPISLHPDNPHYFLWRGKPTVLIGSGEHYGAVLNRPFTRAALSTGGRKKPNSYQLIN